MRERRRCWISGWKTLVAKGGSDLLLVENAPPCMRVQGEIRKIEANTLDGGDIEAAVLPALSRHALEVYRESSIADASYRIEGVGRFRINLHRERGRAAAAIRALPARVPALQELHLPAAVANLAHLPRGLVLIGGPAGSGKSTTLSALIHEINAKEARHIVTIEDPDRIRAHAYSKRDRAGGGGNGRAGFSDGVAGSAAAGAGRDCGGRDARSGDDADCGGGGGNGAPGAVDIAHNRRSVYGGADCGFVSGGDGRIRSGRNWRWRWRRC